MRPLARIALASSWVAAWVTAIAAAQDPRLERLAPDVRAPVAALLDSAHAAGLPLEPLMQRALEGTTKRAAGERVVAAVRQLAADLARARTALGSRGSPAELAAGAAALRAGAPAELLTALRRSRSNPLTVPLAVLTDLVASGVPVDSAAAAVLALAARARDADLVEFRRAVERDIALGVSPGAAVSTDALGFTPNSAAVPGPSGHPSPQQPTRP